MNKDVKEMYEQDGIVKGTKDVFTIYEDDSLGLVSYNGDVKRVHNNVKLVIAGTKGGQRIEYGDEPDGRLRSSLPFRNYDDGQVDKHWTKIK